MSRKRFDVVVVGAGPAGTTLATLVKKRDPSARVLILEKAPFPRHHIGESLLPGMIPVLKEMGVFEKINAGGFPRKMGVVFVWGEDRKPWDADFNNLNLEMVRKYGRLLDTEFSWQVLRSRYDQILLDHARERGVEVWMGGEALAPVEKRGAVTGVVVKTPKGERVTLDCEWLADCSGQKGFLAQARATRSVYPDLKNVAAYAYFKGAKWKFEYQGHPDKTKIFVCSVPEGWFWYIPLSKDEVSVGLVSKASFVQKRGVKDFREYFFSALKRCPEIWPLLKDAEVMRGVDAANPEQDFFSIRDWSFINETASGGGWLAAGDAAFFIDPLLSSGVMMAHLSGHRAAYTINTLRREKDARLRRLLLADYDRFCKEVGGSFLALVRYWYHHDPNARTWWNEAKTALGARTPIDLTDQMSFVAVAAGLTYYFERAYTSQTLLFGSAGVEHGWQWEGTKLELKRWTRQILAIVETGFFSNKRLRATPANRANVRQAEAAVKLEELPDAWAPRWALPRERALTFLPSAEGGVLRPIHRLRVVKRPAKDADAEALNPKRVLPLSYIAILDLIDGKRSIADIKERLLASSGLPRDVVEGQVFRILKDLHVLGALAFSKKAKAGRAGKPSAFRQGESYLREGRPAEAEASLSEAIDAGERGPWVYALRGEARRHLGRLDEALRDLDESLRLSARPPAAKRGGRLETLLEEFEAQIRRGWIEDRILILRAKLHLLKEDHAAARADSEAALRLNPRQSEALIVRAKAAAAGGDLAAAREDLRAALAIESGRKGQG